MLSALAIVHTETAISCQRGVTPALSFDAAMDLLSDFKMHELLPLKEARGGDGLVCLCVVTWGAPPLDDWPN